MNQLVEQFAGRRASNRRSPPQVASMPALPPMPETDELSESVRKAQAGLDQLRRDNQSLQIQLEHERETHRVEREQDGRAILELEAQLKVTTETLRAVQAERDTLRRWRIASDTQLATIGSLVLRWQDMVRAELGTPTPDVVALNKLEEILTRDGSAATIEHGDRQAEGTPQERPTPEG